MLELFFGTLVILLLLAAALGLPLWLRRKRKPAAGCCADTGADGCANCTCGRAGQTNDEDENNGDG